jgi:hypothetical protein
MGRTSTAVEAVSEDLAALGEAVVGEVTMVQVWRHVVSEVVDGRGSVEADPARRSVVGEAWR